MNNPSNRTLQFFARPAGMLLLAGCCALPLFGCGGQGDAGAAEADVRAASGTVGTTAHTRVEIDCFGKALTVISGYATTDGSAIWPDAIVYDYIGISQYAYMDVSAGNSKQAGYLFIGGSGDRTGRTISVTFNADFTVMTVTVNGLPNESLSKVVATISSTNDLRLLSGSFALPMVVNALDASGNVVHQESDSAASCTVRGS